MRTIEVELFKIDELDSRAKDKAISQFCDLDNSHVYDEAHETVKAFNNLFGTIEGNRSWLDVQTCFNDGQMDLRGLRLRTYIINNYWNDLNTGKYFSLWSKTEKSKNFDQTGLGKLKSRYSKVIKHVECPFTGVCYDQSILWPIIQFVDDYNTKADYYQNMDIEDLMKDCFAELESDLNSEIEAMQSEEYLTDFIHANEYEFTATGDLY